ncbi:MAG TPA: tetratricopeptide repeat protein, partial [Gemmatimonadales bacterium]|nr:tetratricopeptide repeat protein [Gemmatimonadales bacterium]
FFPRLEADAPTTYRAHLVASLSYADAGLYPEAERAARRAFELFKGDPQVFEQFGQTLRRQGHCADALPVLAEGVQRFPDRTVARSRLIECALAMGDTARARGIAAEAVALGQTEFEATLKRLTSP